MSGKTGSSIRDGSSVKSGDSVSVEREYNLYLKKKVRGIFLLCAAVCLVFLFALTVGSSNLSVWDALVGILGRGGEKTTRIIFHVRLPRVLGAIVAGSGLSLSGVLLQSVLGNPLASPSTLGINSAAAFGANLAIIFFGIGTTANRLPVGIGFFAFVFSAVSSLAVLTLSKTRQFSRHSVLLAGVGIASFFTAGTTVLQYFAEDTQIASAIFWTFGDLGRLNYTELAVLAAVTFPLSGYIFRRRWDFNAMDMGDEAAHSLGTDTRALTRNAVIVASTLTAFSVSFVGMIGFVGLIAPQIVRRTFGTDKRFMIPASMVLGSLILLFADAVAHAIIAPVILPVGAVTSFFGAPLFLYVLLKERK